MSKKPPEIPYIPNPAMRQIAVPIASLVLDPDNERKHDRANIDAIKGLIRKFGIMEPIGVREGLVIRGNGTTIALRELAAEKATALEPLSKMLADPTAPLDWSLVPALDYQHLDESAAAAWRVGHNRSAELGKWDWEKLQTTLRNTDVEWTEIGWEQTELEAILSQAHAEQEPPETTTVGEHEREIGTESDDVLPDTHADPITKVGDLWLLGNHRLICGDCRDPHVIERLIGVARINVAFTSPPYASQRKYDETSGFLPIHPDEFVDWFESVQANVQARLAEDGSWFVNIKPASEGLDTQLYVLDLVLAHARRWGWHFATELCWQRGGLPGLPVRRFRNQFEPIYQFTLNDWKFRPDRVMVPSSRSFKYSVDNPGRYSLHSYAGQGGSISTQTTDGQAYPGNRLPVFERPDAIGHSAAFPVGLPSFIILAYSDEGDNVFDPFSGSGSTIIACERTGRRGFGCEISPSYCDVIVARWERETGRKAQRSLARVEHALLL